MSVEGEKLIEMYTRMLAIRRFEEKAVELFSTGQLPGASHPYIGEEAVAVGVCANLRPDDRITSTHRGHGHCIAKGGDAKRMMAELLGKKTGYCKGKGGSMHIADFGIGILGANGIVGAGLPISTGSGLAAKLLGTDQVTVCFFGDGAANQGGFHSSLNLASIWKLPVVYVCENNMYAVSTPAAYAISIEDVADRGAAYGIPGVAVDGQDVMAVYEAAHEAVARARKGEGPSLIECKTYRYLGHMLGEEMMFGPDRTYRSQEEVERWKKRDPIALFEARLEELGVLTEEQRAEINEQVTSQIEEAVAFARESPLPAPEDALADVFV
jgi:acetoin:2,6-dichlorophenolindophenol oxidoreductase subunit alpha